MPDATLYQITARHRARQFMPTALTDFTTDSVASGMAAIACSLEQLLVDGGEIISSPTIYGGTFALFKNVFPKQNITTTFVDLNNFAAVEKAITNAKKALVHDHIDHCLEHAVSDQSNNPVDTIREFKEITKYL